MASRLSAGNSPHPPGRNGLEADITDEIRRAILGKQFSPGERLIELELAARWEVSQGTIRAALKRLQHEGLVEYRPRRGNFVHRIEGNDVIEIYTLRDALEALGARLAAKRIDEFGRKSLDRLMQAMRSAVASDNRSKLMELDFDFHRAVIAISGHKRLQEMYISLEAQTRLFMTMTDKLHRDLTGIVALHEPLMDAICRGDEDAAFAFASRHNEADGAQLAKMIEQNSELAADAALGAARRQSAR